MKLNEEKMAEARKIGNLVANVLIAAIDYGKARDRSEGEAAERRLRSAIEEGAVSIAQSESK